MMVDANKAIDVDNAAALRVREMQSAEVEIVTDYFHRATPEHLDMLGVDPSRLPTVGAWRERLRNQLNQPIEQRTSLFLIWLRNESPTGFSSCNKIAYGERANMHLHIVEPSSRNRGLGTAFVRQSVDCYLELLKLKKLYCEPNAFNVAPNRTLQRGGFRYIKTYMTVPGSINYHQAVTQWVIER